MKSCKRIGKLIPLYISDDLKLADKAAVEGHLASCPVCQEEVKVYQSLKEALSGSGLPLKSEGFWNDYWTELEAKLQAKPQPLPQPVIKSVRFLQLVRYAAIFLIGLVIGYLGYQFGGGTKLRRMGPSTGELTPPSEVVTAQAMENDFFGMKVQPVSRALSEHLHLPPGQGVVICGSFNQSPFQTAYLQPADIILEFNGQSIANPEILSSLSRETDKMNLKIIRQGQVIITQITVKPEMRIIIGVKQKGGEGK